MRDGGNLVPIGRFAQVSRLTIKALRHYDDLGLLKPAFTDPHSGYRYYSLRQLEQAQLIRALRDAELPLDEIRLLLAEPDPAEVRARLLLHQTRLAERITLLHAALQRLESFLTPPEVPMTYEITITTPPRQHHVTMRVTAEPHEIGPVIGRAIDETASYLAQRQFATTGGPVVIYHEHPAQHEHWGLEVGWPVPDAVSVEDGFACRTLGGTPAATTLHRGPYDQLALAYRAVAEWCQQHGHELGDTPWEVYLGPPDVPVPETMVYWTIR